MNAEDYRMVAVAVSRAMDDQHLYEGEEEVARQNAVKDVAHRLADSFRNDNPYFDRMRFLAAAGVRGD